MKSKRKSFRSTARAAKKIGSAPLIFLALEPVTNKPAGIFLHQILDFIQKGRNALHFIDENRFNPFVFYFFHGLLTEPGRIF